MKELKFLFETTVKRQVEEASIEKKEENGQTIEIKRTVKKAKPIKVALLKPERKLFKEAEMFYAKTLSNYLKAGLLPYSLVAKRYANDGGPLTDQERSRLHELREQARALEADFFKTTPDDEASKKQKNDILVQINDINQEVSNIQNAYADIFDSTAEMKSRNDTIEWWVLYMIYIDEDGKGYVPMFAPETYEEKLTKLEDVEDTGDPFYLEVVRKLSYLISFWFTARNTVTKIDFDTMEKLYMETVSNYKVQEEGSDLKITEVNPPPTPEPEPEPKPTVEEQRKEKAQVSDVTMTSGGPSGGSSTL
jgi:hypothetical protein